MNQQNKNRRRNRLGATAIEFALVAPLVLAIVFGLFEISRVMTVSDAMKTSVIAGAREAGVAQTNASEVRREMEAILDLFGIYNRQIVVTPETIDNSVIEVSIDVTIPLNSDNGMYFNKIVGAEDLQFGTVLAR